MALYEEFQTLREGDIFQATYPGYGGATGQAVCVVVAADTKHATATSITTHYKFEFDRETLTAKMGNAVCTVVSAVPLPKELLGRALELYHKYDPANPVNDPKLTSSQVETLRLLAKHYGV